MLLKLQHQHSSLIPAVSFFLLLPHDRAEASVLCLLIHNDLGLDSKLTII